MTKLAKILSLVLALTMLCGVAFAEEVVYERGDDDEIYDAVLGDFTALMEAAEAARVAALTPEQKKAEEDAKAAKAAKAEEEAKRLAEIHARMVEEGRKLLA